MATSEQRPSSAGLLNEMSQTLTGDRLVWWRVCSGSLI
jgi:hypothetical protein